MRRTLVLTCAVLAAATALLFLASGTDDSEVKLEPGAMEPTDWFYRQRAFPVGDINYEAVREAHRQAAAMRMDAGGQKCRLLGFCRSHKHWRSRLGHRSGEISRRFTSGRVRAACSRRPMAEHRSYRSATTCSAFLLETSLSILAILRRSTWERGNPTAAEDLLRTEAKGFSDPQTAAQPGHR